MKEEIFICSFFNSKENIQLLFNKIIGVALNKKYAKTQKINSIELTNAIFQLTDHEILIFEGKKHNGQRIKELFITSIFIKKFLSHPEFQNITISIPPREESYDICVSMSSSPPRTIENNRGTIDGVAINLQIKEHFDFSLKRDYYDLEYIKKKTQAREEIFLFFNRDYINLSPQEGEALENFLLENKNIAILSAVKSIKDEKGNELLPKNKFSFLLHLNSQKIGLHFDIPSFLTPISSK
jgi:hypothetical protein